jgi:hypothetical protein
MANSTQEQHIPSPLTEAPPELETLSLEVDGEIGTLTLDRPDILAVGTDHVSSRLQRRVGDWLSVLHPSNNRPAPRPK